MTFRLHRKDSSIQGIPLIGLSSQVSSTERLHLKMSLLPAIVMPIVCEISRLLAAVKGDL